MAHLQRYLAPGCKKGVHLFSNDLAVISMAVCLGGPSFQDIFSREYFSMYSDMPRAKQLCHDDILIPTLFLVDDTAHNIEAQFYNSYDGVNFQNELNCDPVTFSSPLELSEFLDTQNSLAMHLHEVMAQNKDEIEQVYAEAKETSNQHNPIYQLDGWDLACLAKCLRSRMDSTISILTFFSHFIVVKLPRHYTILGAGLDAFTTLARPTLISSIYNRMLTAYIRKQYPQYCFDLVIHHDVNIQHPLNINSIDSIEHIKDKTFIYFGSHEILCNYETFPPYHFAPASSHIHMTWLKENDDGTEQWRNKNFMLYLVNTNLIELRNYIKLFYTQHE